MFGAIERRCWSSREKNRLCNGCPEDLARGETDAHFMRDALCGNADAVIP